MSRIGNLPIELPEGVTIEVTSDNLVKIKGKLGELEQQVNSIIKIEVKDNMITFIRGNEEKQTKSYHGLYRSLVNNMIIGVSKGFEIKQELVGVGYKAEMKVGNVIQLGLGYTHPIYLQMPSEIDAIAETQKRGNPIITLKSIDKQLVGQVAAKIRSFRPPEPYKGKGVKYVGEELRRKAGKTAAS
jgi:large subunit ribosomal protein L6